jgi:hypothetical protein
VKYVKSRVEGGEVREQLQIQQGKGRHVWIAQMQYEGAEHLYRRTSRRQP